MSDQVNPPPMAPSEARSSDDTLTPTMVRIIKKCPRARILTLGRSGVGKSSLVNAIFGIPSARVQNIKAGEADIRQEYTSEHNEHFVLHDSRGYEPGDTKKFKIVEDFIKERTSLEKPIGEQLHAIWLCVPVSFAGGRIFEAGDMKIFKLKRGKVPIIVVFTQYDLLSTLVQRQHPGGAPVNETALVEEEFKKRCIQPFKQVTQENIPLIPVSIHRPETLQKLVEVTMQNIQPEMEMDRPPTPLFKRLVPNFGVKKLQGDRADSSRTDPPSRHEGDGQLVVSEDLSNSARVVMAMAQRVDVDVKVEASIEVGKKKYWKAIASGAGFASLRLSSCIGVIHTDIVMIWNIRGMNAFFLDNMFRGLMTTIVEDLYDFKVDNSRTMRDALGSAGAAAGITAAIVAPLAGPAAAVAAPIAAAVFFAAWAYAIYQKSHDVVRCLMAYTVDLIIVLRAVFQASLKDKDGIVLEGDIRQIIDKFKHSSAKQDIHNIIRSFVQEQNPFAKSVVVEKIEMLIRWDWVFMS